MAKKNLSPFFSHLLLFFSITVGATIPLSRCQPVLGVDNGGEWRLLHASVGLSAMHMQLLPGDKVVAFDRTDFGPSNLSLPGGRCRLNPNDLALPLDCTAHSLLLDLASSSFRPLTLLTDTWCSSASLLPDGTFFQSGGFNDGERAIRFLTTGDASDWVELPGYLSVRRWYASNQLLPDGRVIIMGGRLQFSYEFFPRLEPHPLFPFPFLEETRDGDAENNLYPFLHLLPDGTLFVFANTRAVALDPARHLLRALPDIPDGVPRNYPSSGSSALLPLSPDPTDPFATRAEVLVCGGAPRGSFQRALNGSFLPAVRSCGRIVVSDPDPVWAMEDMPLPRTMGNMVLLPTGDVLLINGAGSGTAGWELGRDPVTNPVLYRPSALAGNRFTVLNPSPIPRLYHSSALLDTYGRVLVGGSNPHVGYKFTNVTYPTELSLEAFHPPYLDPRLRPIRPTIVSVGSGSGTGSVHYGEVLAVRFVVESYRPGLGLEVVAMAPVFATHATGMNQRAVTLGAGRVTQVGQLEYETEATAPPSPEIAPPGYYLLFVVHAGVPSQGTWIKLRRLGVN